MELKKGETLMINAALHLPASFLHKAFSNRSGVPLDFFELYYRGKVLKGEAALASWGVVKDSSIEVKMRGRGGARKGKEPMSQTASPISHAVNEGSSSSSALTAPSLSQSRGGMLDRFTSALAPLHYRRGTNDSERQPEPTAIQLQATGTLVDTPSLKGTPAPSRWRLQQWSHSLPLESFALDPAFGSLAPGLACAPRFL